MDSENDTPPVVRFSMSYRWLKSGAQDPRKSEVGDADILHNIIGSLQIVLALARSPHRCSGTKFDHAG